MKTVAKMTVMATVALSSAAAAQDARPTIDQIGVRSADPAPVQQIAPRSGRSVVQAPVQPRPAGPVTQVSSGADSRPSTPQLTGAGQGVRPPAQLYTGGRTAQPSEALSAPAQGRTGVVARVEGADRCDAAASDKQDKACERVIETRSAEFVRPDPTILSPEQRLLVDQRLRNMPATARSGARRLASAGTDAESAETQGIASLVLRPPPPGREETPAEEDASTIEAAAIVNAIINATPN